MTKGEYNARYKIQCIILNIYITFTILYAYNYLNSIDISDWNGIVSSISIQGLAIKSRILHIYMYFFSVIMIGFLNTLWIPKVVACLDVKVNNILGWLVGHFSVYLFILYINKFSDAMGNELNQSFFIFYSISAILGILILSFKRTNIDEDSLFHFMAIHLSGLISMHLLFGSFLNNKIAIDIILSLVLSLFVIFSMMKYGKDNIVLRTCCNWIYIMPLIICTVNELTNIIRTWVKIPFQQSTIIYVALIVSLVVIALLRKTKNENDVNVEILYTPLLAGILSAANLTGYYYRFSMSNNGLFEFGNIGCAIETINRNKLPFIDYFSAHGLRDVGMKIIYSLLNNDSLAYMSDSYLAITNVVALIILYYILKQIFSTQESFWIVLLMPFNLQSNKWCAICFIGMATAYYCIKRKTFSSYLIFAFFLAGAVLYQYDDGVNVGVAVILSLLLLVVLKKITIKWKYSFLSFGGITVTFLGLAFAYCKYHNIDFLDRMIEWYYALSGSSDEWATSEFGDASTFAFLFSYCVAPAVAVINILNVIRYKKIIDVNLAILMLTFSMATILFIPRTVIFHNLLLSRGTTGVLLNFFTWNVALFVFMYWKYGKENRVLNNVKGSVIFVWAFLIALILQAGFVTNEFPKEENTVLCNAYHTTISNEKEYDNRTILSDEAKELKAEYEKLFSYILKKEDTFIDFADVTGLYALTDRIQPFYVSQSPALVTNQFMQEQWIREVESKADLTPIAIVGMKRESSGIGYDICNVPIVLRYDKMAEYLWKNYVPLTLVEDEAIWCRKEKYGEYSEILSYQGYPLISYEYDELAHQYIVGEIPYLGASSSHFSSVRKNPSIKIDLGNNGVYRIDQSNMDISNGNYIQFEASNVEANETARIEVGVYADDDFYELYGYSYNLKEGTQKYLLKISQDFYWYSGYVNAVKVSGCEVINDNIQIICE